MVGEENVAFFQRIAMDLSLVPHSVRHCTKVNGDVRCIRNQSTLGIENGTGTVVSGVPVYSLVQALFDVQTDGDLTQDVAHLLCNSH